MLIRHTFLKNSKRYIDETFIYVVLKFFYTVSYFIRVKKQPSYSGVRCDSVSSD